MKKIALLLLALSITTTTFAKEEIIENGFKAYKEGGSSLAWPAFSKGSPMEGSKELLAQSSQLGQIEAYYGKYVSHEYIAEDKIGKNNKIVYVIMNMEEGSLFGRFHLYKKPDGEWITPNFLFHTNVEQIWPMHIYSDFPDD